VIQAHSITMIGFTVQNGRDNGDGGGILGSGDLIDCTFLGNRVGSNFASYSGGALRGSFTGTRCTFRGNFASNNGGAVAGSFSGSDCLFEFNTADVGSGGAILGAGTISGSVFRGNSAKFGAAIRTTGGRIEDCEFYDHGRFNSVVWQLGGNLTVDGCVFANNRSPAGYNDIYAIAIGGPINSTGTRTTIVQSTFFANDSFIQATTSGGTAIVNINVENTIVTEHLSRVQFCEQGATIVWSCGVTWNNVDGIGGCNSETIVVEADPLFCSPDTENFGITFGSPCLAENSNGCGLIGARPQECGAVKGQAARWGRLKGRY
jgi:hypothetical protein